MKLLLHICCAPCSITCLDALREDGHDVTGFWYNPNIHPFTEYRARKDALADYAETAALPLVQGGKYGLRPFVRAVCGDIDGRCAYCYRCRLEETARYAAEHGFDAFTTTLLVSPYQSRDGLLAAGERAAGQYGGVFLPQDFRPRFREGQQRARDLGLYMQKYCGCVFSEEDRFRRAPRRKPRQT
ncbi:MAG: epoxyqueuosine reductase QueH [Clostridiales bacterium]|nr:epoxyqueuosine reductase QueH [Clostridiales bacterium]